MKKSLILLGFVLFSRLGLSFDTYRHLDSLSLVTIFENAGGFGWTISSGWLTANITSWYGITTANVNGHVRVTEIRLPNNNLTGALVLDANLDQLQVLDVNHNPLTGSTDYSIFTNVNYLDLSYTGIGISSGIGNMMSLSVLNLQGNQITGTIPLSISNLINLTALRLTDNKLTGSLPNLGSMANIQTLDVANNQLSGNFPTELYNLYTLTFISLGINKFTGTISTQIGNLTLLQYLFLGNCQFSGSIPAQIGNLNSLKYLWLGYNQFTGSIPAQINNLINLQDLRLDNNQLSGALPTNFLSNASILETLILDNNKLNGSVPLSCLSSPLLKDARFHNNSFDGFPDIHTLPISSNPNPTEVEIWSNFFTFEDIEPNRNIPAAKFVYTPQLEITGTPITLNPHQPLSLSFAVGGSANTYQWQLNDVNLAGATGNTYTKASVSESDEGAYTLVVNNLLVPSLTIKRMINVTVNNVSSLNVVQGSTNVVNTGTYDFGNVSMNAISGDVTFFVQNLGNAPLIINLAGSSLTGANPSDFSIDLSALNSVINTNPVPVTVRFTPAGTGLRTATISIASNDPFQNPYIINLEGTGVNAPILNVVQGSTTIASNGTFDFGSVLMLNNSGDITFTVQNLGNATLIIDLAVSSLTGANASDFAIDLSALNSPITTNSVPAKIKFIPSSSGLRTATISVVSNDSMQNPYIINLEGTGVKQNQSITFNTIADQTVGAPAFSLAATTSSGLVVSYASSSSKVNISGNLINLVSAGRDTITASQQGDGSFNPALSVDQNFCIKPAKPTVTITNDNTTSPTLTSSASTGNQWFLNGTPISGATGTGLTIADVGVYAVQAIADDCVSAFSDDIPIIITGDLLATPETVSLYPNPSHDFLIIRGITQEVVDSFVIDIVGRSTYIRLEKVQGWHKADISTLSGGMYLLRVSEGNEVHQFKFIKQ